MNRQKIEQRIEILKAQKQSLELSMDDLDIAEYNEYERMIECDEARIEELQSLLDEPEQQPLDAPTHSGWWWNSKVGLILYLGMVENGFAEGDVKYYDFKERFPRFHIAPDVPEGKWLPANNPFGKGEG